jgi:TPR repeat protein
VKRATKWYLVLAGACIAAGGVAVMATDVVAPGWTLYPRCEGLEACRAACDTGDGFGCADLGSFYDEGDGVPRDRAAALAHYERACELGAPPGCARRASREGDEGRREWWERRDLDRELAACERKVLDACRGVARAYADGRGVEKDVQRAAALVEELLSVHAGMCPDRGARVCVAAGDLADGLGSEPSRSLLQRALPYYDKGCALEDAHACWSMGATLERMGKEGRDRIEHACELSEDGGWCWMPGLREDAALLAKQMAKLEPRCTARNRKACIDLVELDNEHPKARPEQARRAALAVVDALLQDECDRGMGDACAALGHLLGGSQALGRVRLRVHALYEQACSLGESHVCSQVESDRPLRGVAGFVPGKFHDCVLEASGRGSCWGLDGDGQLGVPARKNDHSPVPLPMPVFGLALANSSTCAVTTSRTVECWGDAAFGQLGDGRGPDRHEPKRVPGPAEVVQLRASSHGFGAVAADGRAWFWGSTGFGSADQATELDRKDVRAIYLLELHGCVRTHDAVECRRGRDPWQRLSAVAPDDDVQLSDGGMCVRHASGKVSCATTSGEQWLRDDQAELRQLEGVSNAVELSLTNEHGCARAEGGAVTCWELESPKPAAIDGLDDAVQLGRDCAVVRDGSVLCWEGGGYRELPYGTLVVLDDGS